MIYEIPLEPESQIIKVTLDGNEYMLRIVWRGTNYVIDIAQLDGTPVVNGLAVVIGADLLAQLQHLGLTGEGVLPDKALVVLTDVFPALVPQYDTLGITSHLCVVT